MLLHIHLSMRTQPTACTQTHVGTLVSVCASIKCEWTCFSYPSPFFCLRRCGKKNTYTPPDAANKGELTGTSLLFPAAMSRARCAATRWERANKDRTAVRFRGMLSASHLFLSTLCHIHLYLSLLDPNTHAHTVNWTLKALSMYLFFGSSVRKLIR